jgi:hypothetical protein
MKITKKALSVLLSLMLVLGTVSVGGISVSAEVPAVTLWGDANCDNQVDMADIVLIMQSLANPNRYGRYGTDYSHITLQGEVNADVDNSINGVTAGDTTKIQEYLLGKISSLNPNRGTGASSSATVSDKNADINADVSFSFMDEDGSNKVNLASGENRTIGVDVNIDAGSNPISALDVQFTVTNGIKISEIYRSVKAFRGVTVSRNIENLRANYTTLDGDSPMTAESGKSAFMIDVEVPAGTPDGVYYVDFSSCKIFKDNTSFNYTVSADPLKIVVGNETMEISTYSDLRDFASRVNSGETGLNAILMNDIECKNDDGTAAKDWTPIGNLSNNYIGTFDGDGHIITGLTYNNPNQDYAGLFGCVGEGGKVRNVGLEGGSITGQKYVGGVIGLNYGTVTNCYNTGGVSGKDYVGGVVGYNYNSSVSSCYNTGSVTATANFAYAGGVVGENCANSSVENCYNTGSVTATEQYAYAGGVVGYNYMSSTISNCYNTGSVSGDYDVGGVVGYNVNNSSVENCYNTGSVTATGNNAYAGGVAGENFLENSSVKNCCYDSDRAPGIPAIGYEDIATHTNVEGLTTAQMTGANALDNMVFEYGAGEENPWLTRANDDINSFYPHLKGFAYDSEPTAENWPPKIVNVIEYPLWVGGNQVTSDNMDDVLKDGTVRFEAVDGKHILTLENADITESYRYEEFDNAYTTANIVTAYPVNDTELTIVLIGENKLSAAEYGIRDSNSRLLTITGDGSLDVTADIMAIQGIDLFIDGADITAKGAGGANGDGSGIITDNLTIRNSAVSATGSEFGNGICGTSIKITDSVITAESEMNIAVASSTLSVSGNSTVIAECASDEDSAIIAGEFVFDDRNDITEPWNYRLENNGDYKLVYNADDNTAAKKVVIGKGYAVTFLDGDGETVLYKTKVLEGANPEYKGAAPTRTDPSGGYTYAFSGWKDGNNNEYAPGAAFPAAESDITYTAQFTETPVDYTVTFFVDGKQYSQSTVPFGAPVSSPRTPQKEYYDFTGWDAEIPDTMPAQNLEFNAVFKAIEYTATFTADDETVKEVKFTVEDDSIDEPAVPEKEGYEGKWTAYTLAAADITIKAEYTAIEYTATFVDKNGETVEEVKFTVETESIEEPAVPEKTNYTGEWEEYTLGANDITIKPVYTLAGETVVNTDSESEITTDYKESKRFVFEPEFVPEGATAHVFYNGEDRGEGTSIEVKEPTDDYTVECKVLDAEGNEIASSGEIKVKVKNSFFDRLKWFFNNLLRMVIEALIEGFGSVC